MTITVFNIKHKYFGPKRQTVRLRSSTNEAVKTHITIWIVLGQSLGSWIDLSSAVDIMSDHQWTNLTENVRKYSSNQAKASVPVLIAGIGTIPV